MGSQIRDFGAFEGCVSETVQDMMQVTINGKSHELSISAKSVTLDDLERRNSPCIANSVAFTVHYVVKVVEDTSILSAADWAEM